MIKLPASSYEKLIAGLPADSLPGHGEPGFDEVFDVWDELGNELAVEWEEADAPQARREVAALIELSRAVPFDGVVVGIACNQPGLVAAARGAARSMSMPAVGKVLDEMARHVPPEVIALDDPSARLGWYQSEAGAGHAEALEALDERVEEEISEELMLGCLRRVIRERGLFFEAD
ncbi:MAG: hypothetical protein IT436_08885 [Phycisphaerales bacterium]|nr:hypothetical protein [Phycisphaerales bacterium]